MKWLVNGVERDKFNKMKPRKIQEEAISRIRETVSNHDKLLVNMPCRSGKTFTTIYSSFLEGIELLIVLCGKVSAKNSYVSDSAWLDENDNKCGYNVVLTNNAEIKKFLNSSIPINSTNKVLIEVTPQLLNQNSDLVNRLGELAKTVKSALIFDEAHFTEQTSKTKNIVSTIIE